MSEADAQITDIEPILDRLVLPDSVRDGFATFILDGAEEFDLYNPETLDSKRYECANRFITLLKEEANQPDQAQLLLDVL